jgi:hypothetical protein
MELSIDTSDHDTVIVYKNPTFNELVPLINIVTPSPLLVQGHRPNNNTGVSSIYILTYTSPASFEVWTAWLSIQGQHRPDVSCFGLI